MRSLVEEDWGFYAVMDLADDEFGRPLDSPEGYRPKTLASVIEGEKALPLKECVALAFSLANGLVALQRHHLLHRDIKPGNVLYVGGRPVLSDPGLVVDEAAAVSSVGTPGYLPPERKFTGPASDIYSLGLTLKAASFGRQVEDLYKGPAMEADTGAALFPLWWRILNKATDPTPSRRYQSAKALLRDLKLLRVKALVKAAIPSVRATTKSVIGIAVLSIVAIVVVAAFAWKRNVNTVRRDVQWINLVVDGLNDAGLKGSSVGWKIDEVAATNKVVGAELQSLLDRMKSLGDKVDSLSHEINMLSNKVPKDRRDGIADEKEFQSASQLAEDRKKAREEINKIYEELRNRLGLDK